MKLCQWEEVEAQADEMWSFVKSNQQQRWLWPAIDHRTGKVLAYVLATHEDEAFVRLKALLSPFGSLNSIPMAGERMNGISTLLSIQWANVILKKSSGNI